MPLIERLTGIGYDPSQGARIDIGTFFAALRDRFHGGLSNAEVVSAFALTASDVDDLKLAVRRVNGPVPHEWPPLGEAATILLREMEDVLLLAEAGIGYTTLQQVRARINKA